MMSVGGDRCWGKGFLLFPSFSFSFLVFAWSELRGRLGDVLWGQADSAWEAIPMSYINTLVDSMPRRLEAVRAAHGGETKY